MSLEREVRNASAPSASPAKLTGPELDAVSRAEQIAQDVRPSPPVDSKPIGTHGHAGTGGTATPPDSASPETVDLELAGISRPMIEEATVYFPEKLASIAFGIQPMPMEEPLRGFTKMCGVATIESLAPSLTRVPPWAGYLVCLIVYFGTVGMTVQAWKKNQKEHLPDTSAGPGAEKPLS